MTLIGYELRRIIGRRGSFFGVMGVAVAIALLFAFVGDSGDQTGDAWTQVIGTPMVFGATVVGALAGSYDTAQGTMRYLVLTGVQRWKLVAIRVPALFAAIALISLPAVLVGLVAMLSGPDGGADIARGIFGGMTFGACWGIVAMAIGTLLRSNGAGIAVALVLYLLSSGITVFVQAQVSETVGDYLLPNVIGVVALFGSEMADGPGSSGSVPYAGALIALILWLTLIVGLAIARVERDEY
ncbi:MAG: hypothetical protein Q7T55_14155 [Solirubrobacteraceae bacterium]|nr:hypothetical protein [Solirubrobacteraceae bacterium]